MKNAQILRESMKDYGLTQQDTADLLDLSKSTIISWLRPETNEAHRTMPDREVTFLKCLLRSRQKKAPL